MIIKEFKNGKFQVWSEEGLVLRPCNLEWLKSIHSDNDFMYFDSLALAKDAAIRVVQKEDGEQLVKTHKI